MEDVPYFDSVISMGIASILADNQETIRLFAELLHIRDIIVAVAQNEQDLGGNFPQQLRGWITVGDLGRRQHLGKRKKYRGDR